MANHYDWRNLEAMQKITEQFYQFIREQPDNREIRMYEASSKHKCGCLLVQFGKHIGLKDFNCSWDGLHSNKKEQIRLDYPVMDIISDALDKDITTYKQAKQILNDYQIC